MQNRSITIRGRQVYTAPDNIHIDKLLFLIENPRVYACTFGESGFEDLPCEQQQDIIFKKLCEEPSVKNLRPEIRAHGGLVEPIIVRHDTNEVIEGNSRLAVYRLLHKENPDGSWEYIQCDIVDSLTDDQQAAFLNQIHVKGKTQWSAYEKANFAYVRKRKGKGTSEIAKLFGEHSSTIRKRVNAIQKMKDNDDDEQAHFSYYDVMVNTPDIKRAMDSDKDLERVVLTEVKNLDSDKGDQPFTAQDLRNKFPVVLKKRKVLKDFKEGRVSLDAAYQRAKVSSVEENVRNAKGLLMDISEKEIKTLEQSRFNSFKAEVRKLTREMRRINKILEHIEQ